MCAFSCLLLDFLVLLVCLISLMKLVSFSSQTAAKSFPETTRVHAAAADAELALKTLRMMDHAFVVGGVRGCGVRGGLDGAGLAIRDHGGGVRGVGGWGTEEFVGNRIHNQFCNILITSPSLHLIDSQSQRYCLKFARSPVCLTLLLNYIYSLLLLMLSIRPRPTTMPIAVLLSKLL